ncbi:unnamed protein product [Linum tenue]|uniref:Uncharacterized protein n=1 Tax=Linum tenue TaxID=586396 RepID=A0AAV0LT57_9ROSI|nr:unnamed protein product [Linum tenue]
MAFSPLPPAAIEPAAFPSSFTHPFPLRENGFKPPASNRWAQGGRRRRAPRIAAVVGGGGDELSSAAATMLSGQQGQASTVTWEIVVGATAGVLPFVVAGIEFSKRIIEQRRCEVCGGSGLVLMEDKDNREEYCRCPGCGGFLPWQSWKRFFTG